MIMQYLFLLPYIIGILCVFLLGCMLTMLIMITVLVTVEGIN